MISHLHDCTEILNDEIDGITHASCLSHVIQLSLKDLIETIRIRARNESIITRWKDDESERERHSDAAQGDGVPWTLKKASQR